MTKPDPIKEPSYNWPTGRTDDDATPVEKALAALKVGALLAGTVTIALIYLGTYAGLEGRSDLVSMCVLAAFLTPSLAAFLLARRRDRRRRRERR
ncbi:MAG: hypothetical protein H6R27_770 [Proteobacteria bacterium]|nr:hypothetical protein [Pseudomonadota bacterium]